MERAECFGDAASSGSLLMRLMVNFDIAVVLGVDHDLLAICCLSLLLSLHEAGEGLHFVDVCLFGLFERGMSIVFVGVQR